MGGTPCRSRGGLRSSTPEEEGAADMMCDELTSSPMHMNFSLERREKWGKGSFMIWFKISLSYSDLTGNKIKFKKNLFPQ